MDWNVFVFSRRPDLGQEPGIWFCAYEKDDYNWIYNHANWSIQPCNHIWLYDLFPKTEIMAFYAVPVIDASHVIL